MVPGPRNQQAKLRKSGWTKDLRKRWENSTKPITVRIDTETYAALHTRATQARVSINHKLRDYIEWGLENDA